MLWALVATKYHLRLWKRLDVNNRYAVTDDGHPPKDTVAGTMRKTAVTHFRMRILKIDTPTPVTELAEFFPDREAL